MKHPAATNSQFGKRIGHRIKASVRRGFTREPSIGFEAVRPSPCGPSLFRCMSRVHGGRLCGAPAMANRRCPQHGGKVISDQTFRRLHINQILRAGPFGTNGCALNDAVVAYRTQRRLERLVEIANRRSGLDPDQGAPEPTEPA